MFIFQILYSLPYIYIYIFFLYSMLAYLSLKLFDSFSLELLKMFAESNDEYSSIRGRSMRSVFREPK